MKGIASGAEQIELKQHYGDSSPKGSFLSRVQHTRSEIDGLDGEINNIGRLHQRILSSPDGQAKDQLEQHTTQIQVKFTAIKDEIKSLERDVASLPSGDDRENKSKQLNAIRKRFQDYLSTYQKSEQKYLQSCETQFERQIKIAYPDATEPEVRHMMDNWDSEKVFQTAVSRDHGP